MSPEILPYIFIIVVILIAICAILIIYNYNLDIWRPPIMGGRSKKKNNNNPFNSRYIMPKKMADNHIIIIIPYRDNEIQERKEQLEKIIPHLKRKFKEAKKDNYTIVIAEQSEKGKFNRGKILNAGYAEIIKNTSYIAEDIHKGQDQKKKKPYFIIHDVDMYPSKELFEYYLMFPEVPIHLASGTKKYPYNEFMGGIVSLSKRSMELTNGFPNNYWGWGGEDDELRRRIFRTHKFIWRPEQTGQEFEEAKHEWDPKNWLPKEERKKLTKENRNTWKKNGLSNLKYKVLSRISYKDDPKVQKITFEI